jgi:peptidyl-prolyl cis-trans isomerase A (cyclophilin A)
MPEKMTKREKKILEKQRKMQKIKKIGICLLIVCIIVSISVYAYITKPETKPATHNRIATIETNMGTIKIELYEDKAPITTANFISLAQSGFYNGTIFHRVIDDFMIQGGGFTPDMQQKTSDQIPFEYDPDLTHVDGAVAMASTGAKVGGTCQFYICDGAQPFLDGNYTVFAQVIDGMDVVRQIASVSTHTENGMDDVPVEDVIIIDVTIDE